MLLELRINHLALVDEVILPLGPELTVLTGETGAGKSLIAGAFSLLCGGKADKDLVRLGEESAFVEGVFDLTAEETLCEDLARAGIRIASDGILVLRRELRNPGRGRVLINGLVSSLALLQRVGPRLLLIQSQDQQRELRDPAFARRFLDEQLQNGDLLEQMGRRWREYQRLEVALEQRRQEESLAREQLELWQYQFEELSRARLRTEEEAELADALVLKRHARTLQEGVARALDSLAAGQAPAQERLGEALSALQPLQGKSPKVDGAVRSLLETEETLAEAIAVLNRFLDGLEVDPGGLEEMEARKALYEELRRKYRRDTPGLLALTAALGDKIERQESAASDLESLQAELETARAGVTETAGRLHKTRTEGAGEIASRAEACLRPLALPHLEVRFETSPRLDAEGPVELARQRCRAAADGCDRVELQVRTNPGERMGNVGIMTSGGECSRILLGLISLASRAGGGPLMLFDEIDSGLGMDTAQPVAGQLRKLAAGGQVICITHLPTMAVHGACHFKVGKQTRDGRTVLNLRPLAGEDRVAEVARLLGGEGFAGGDLAAQRAYALDLLATGSLADAAEAEG